MSLWPAAAGVNARRPPGSFRLLVLSQDEHLARLIDGAAAALARMGLTADDLLADLPVAGEGVRQAANHAACVRPP